MSDSISFELSYHGFFQAPGTSWAITANQQYLSVCQMGAKDNKEWSLVIVSTQSIPKPLGIEPIDLALQELESDTEELQKNLIRILELPHTHVGTVSRFLMKGYELNLHTGTKTELDILPLRLRCMVEQMPSRIDLFQRVRNKFI